MKFSLETVLRRKLAVLARGIAHPYTFVAAVVASIGWIVYGHAINYSEHWFRSTTLMLGFFTFIVVFIVQFSEETESAAMQTKLDALVKADHKIDNDLIAHEDKLQGIKE